MQNNFFEDEYAKGGVVKPQIKIMPSDIVLTDIQLKLIKSGFSKKTTIPILDYVLIKDKKATVSNFDFGFWTTFKIDAPDGIYEFFGEKILRKVDENIDDYPEIEKDNPKLIAQIPAHVINAMRDANYFCSNDEIRPILNGVNIKSESNKIFVIASDQKSVYNNYFNFENKDFNIIIPKESVLKIYESSFLFEPQAFNLFYVNKFHCMVQPEIDKDYYFTFHPIYGDFPDYYTKYIPENYDFNLNINDYDKLKSELNKLKKKDKYKIRFETNGYVEIQQTGGKDAISVLQGSESINTSIDFIVASESKIITKRGILIMPILDVERSIISFDDKILKKLLNFTPNNKLKLYFNGSKLAAFLSFDEPEFKVQRLYNKLKLLKLTKIKKYKLGGEIMQDAFVRMLQEKASEMTKHEFTNSTGYETFVEGIPELVGLQKGAKTSEVYDAVKK